MRDRHGTPFVSELWYRTPQAHSGLWAPPPRLYAAAEVLIHSLVHRYIFKKTCPDKRHANALSRLGEHIQNVLIQTQTTSVAIYVPVHRSLYHWAHSDYLSFMHCFKCTLIPLRLLQKCVVNFFMFVKINILHTLRESQYVYVHGEFSNFVRKHDGYRIHSFDVANNKLPNPKYYHKIK